MGLPNPPQHATGRLQRRRALVEEFEDLGYVLGTLTNDCHLVAAWHFDVDVLYPKRFHFLYRLPDRRHLARR